MSRVRAGLCSITFRDLGVDEIVDLASEVGLEAIEWGGDVHVPHGDVDAAERARRRCADEGLEVSSYGSYLNAGRRRDRLEPVLDTAEALGAHTVRVWAGYRRPSDLAGDDRDRIVGTLGRWSAQAGDRSIRVATEFHRGTLTETAASTDDLLAAVPGLSTYWQPLPGASVTDALSRLDQVADRLANVHVCRPGPDDERLPLAGGLDLWSQVIPRVAATEQDGRHERFVLLEGVHDDDPDAFRADAATLRELLG